MRDRETAVTRINLSPDWLGLSLSRRMTIAANTLGDDGSSLFKVNRAIGLALIFSQRSVVVISCHDKTCHFSRTGCVNIISSEDWRDRGEFVLSRLGLMLRKHCLTVSDISRLTLTQLVSPNTLRSNIKLSSTQLGCWEYKSLHSSQFDMMIGWNVSVCCVYVS